MDNITHTLLGVALAKTKLGRLSPLAGPAIIVGANLPDLDIFVRNFGGRPAFLIYHRGITHALLGVAAEVLLLTAVFAALERVWPWVRRRSAGRDATTSEGAGSAAPEPIVAPPPRRPLIGLLLAVLVALLTHPTLDLLNTYGLRPWLPFSDKWYYGDLVFILDPWLWLILGGTACLAGRRTRRGSAIWILLLLPTSALVLLVPQSPLALRVVWPAAAVVLAAARLEGLGRDRPTRAVAIGAAVAAAYLGGLGLTRAIATRTSDNVLARAIPADEIMRERTRSPQPGDPLTWEFIAETAEAVYRHRVRVLPPAASGTTRTENGLDDPCVARAAATREGRAWLVFARHPVAMVVRQDGGCSVLLMDARYGLLPQGGFASFRVEVPDESRAERPNR